MVLHVTFIRHSALKRPPGLEDNHVRDPPLSPKGIKLCADVARERFDGLETLDLIIVSPMLRTLQTASLALRKHIDAGALVWVNSDCAERMSSVRDLEHIGVLRVAWCVLHVAHATCLLHAACLRSATRSVRCGRPRRARSVPHR